MNEFLIGKIKRIRTIAFAVGIIGLILCIVGGVQNSRSFFINYLFGYLFWLGLALGSFEIVMIHHLTGGRWGYVTRRFFEAAMMTIPIMALFFVPLFFGLQELYLWAQPAAVAHSEILQHKKMYMNEPFFIGRTIFFFLLWSFLAWLLRKWSLQQDQTPILTPTKRLRTLSGIGVALYPLTATFAYIDWVMSLEPDWHSTMFVVIIIAGQILTAFAFSVILLTLFRNHTPLSNVVTSLHFHHLGNFLLTFVMFWTYVAFGQFLIIWSGNLPREISWYLHRIAGRWKYLVGVLAAFHFFGPFFLLLFRPIKQKPARLVGVAVVIFLMHIINVYWLILPTFFPTDLACHWLALASLLGVGGIWTAVFLTALMQHNLLPQNDPRNELVLTHA